MDITEILDKYGLQITLILILLGFIGYVFRLLWKYFTEKVAEYEKKLAEAQALMQVNQEKFITALTAQNEANKALAESIKPFDKNMQENLKILNRLVKLVQLQQRSIKI